MGSVLHLSLALLFLASADPSRAQKAGEAPREAEVEEGAPLTVEEGAPLTVECPLRVEQRARWRLEGREPPADLEAAEAAADGRLVARLSAARARPQHAGLYSCGPEPAQRVRLAVLPRHGADEGKAPAGMEPAPVTAAAAAAPASGVALKLHYFDVGRPLVLNCSLEDAPVGGGFVWRKNGTALEALGELRERHTLEEGGAVLRVGARTVDDDFGNYTCGVAGVSAEVMGWEVRGRPVAKLQLNTNVVEGQKLRLVCRLLGKPYPPVEWRVRNESAGGNETYDAREALGTRVTLSTSEQGVAGAVLLLEPAERADAGEYWCAPQAEGATAATTTLRVKDKYAALWPFLGICAEVFVLCAIILVYEKRRTKPELDDSDTDNHDQKKS